MNEAVEEVKPVSISDEERKAALDQSTHNLEMSRRKLLRAQTDVASYEKRIACNHEHLVGMGYGVYCADCSYSWFN